MGNVLGKGFAFAAGLMLAGGVVLAQQESSWPQFRGPNRDDISAETGLLKKWPEGGPKLLWTAQGCGQGYASVAVAGGMIYTAGDVEKNSVVTAFDMSGKRLWSVENGPANKGDRPGAHAVPTVDGNRLYCMSPLGDLICLEAASGNKIWSLNILTKFNGRNIQWRLAEAVLVDGNNLICSPGAADAGVVALDKTNGNTVWTCKELGDKPGYASPIIVDYKGIRQIVTMTSVAAVGVDSKTGKLLWRMPHETKYEANIPTPIFQDGFVFACSGYGTGGELLKISVDGTNVQAAQVWKTSKENKNHLDNHHGGVILYNGFLYGSSSGGKWMCLDFKTGEAKYQADGVGKGSVTCADGMLYCLSETGVMGLVKADPTAHEVISKFTLPLQGGPKDVWAHPVVCGGRLYLRYHDTLYAYEIKG